MRRRIAHALAGLVGGGLLLLATAVVGKLTRDGLRDQERGTVAFADIDCPPPPGMERADFLDEVLYLSGLSDRVRLRDERLAVNLAEAFARHPWVEKVERVEAVPPGQVHVRLVYRTPMLAVALGDQVRAVDGGGVLLPPQADTRDLPVFRGKPAAPAGPSGTAWGDPAVETAAHTAAFLHAQQARLHLAALQPQADGTLVLSTAAGMHIRWGHAPDAEGAAEAPAARKLERLLKHCEAHDAVKELDVREKE